MSTPKGFPSTDKLERTGAEHVSVTPVGYKQAAMNVFVQWVAQFGASQTAEAGSTDEQIVVTGIESIARKGDIIRITSGANQQVDVLCYEVETDTIHLGAKLPADVGVGDTFQILRGITPTTDSTGAVGAPGPIQFILDGSNQIVTEDTATPANNNPLPVKLTGVTGDVSINAANLNLEVQLSDQGANADAVQVGDGTNRLVINADGSISIGDGGGILGINPDNSIKVSGSSGTALDVGPGTISSHTIRINPASDSRFLLDAIYQTITGFLSMRLSNGTNWADYGPGVQGADTLRTVPAQDATHLLNTRHEFAVTPLSVRKGNGASFDAYGSGADGADVPRSTLSTRHEDATTPVSVRITDGSAFQDLKAAKASSWLKRNDNSSVNITTAAYVELIASTASDITRMHIFDSSGEGFIIATGAVASETDILYVPPGGSDAPYDIAIPSGTRISAKALTNNMTVGDLIITALN